MSGYFAPLRALHVACAVASISLFVLRHVLTLRAVNWRKSVALRVLPHAVDTVLLASAIALTIVIGQYPFVDSWLTVKVFALIVYIALGLAALKPTRSQGVRRMAFFAAVLVFAFIVTVARTHSPFGIFGRWL